MPFSFSLSCQLFLVLDSFSQKSDHNTNSGSLYQLFLLYFIDFWFEIGTHKDAGYCLLPTLVDLGRWKNNEIDSISILFLGRTCPTWLFHCFPPKARKQTQLSWPQFVCKNEKEAYIIDWDPSTKVVLLQRLLCQYFTPLSPTGKKSVSSFLVFKWRNDVGNQGEALHATRVVGEHTHTVYIGLSRQRHEKREALRDPACFAFRIEK